MPSRMTNRQRFSGVSVQRVPSAAKIKDDANIWDVAAQVMRRF